MLTFSGRVSMLLYLFEWRDNGEVTTCVFYAHPQVMLNLSLHSKFGSCIFIIIIRINAPLTFRLHFLRVLLLTDFYFDINAFR